MRLVTLRLACSIIAVLAATLPAVTLAALPEALDNVVGNTFTGTSGEGKFTDPETKLTIVCKKAKASGVLTGPKTGEGTGDFEECTVAGLAAHSLGDTGGVVLIPAAGELCYINKSTKEVGLLLRVSPVHIEVPTIGELLLITGEVVGKVSPINKLTTTGTDVDSGKTRCEGSEDALSFEKNENGKPLAAELTRTVEVTFAKDAELMA